MKIIRTSNSNKLKISRVEWEQMGKQAGWFSDVKDAWKMDRLNAGAYIGKFIEKCREQAHRIVEEGQYSDANIQDVENKIASLQQITSNPEKAEEFVEFAIGQMGTLATFGPAPKTPLTVLDRFLRQ